MNWHLPIQCFPNYQIKNFVEIPQNFININTNSFNSNFIFNGLNGGVYVNNIPNFVNAGIRNVNPMFVGINNAPNFIMNPFQTLSFFN